MYGSVLKIMNKSLLKKRNIPVAPNCSTEQLDEAFVFLRKVPGVVKMVFDNQKRCISIEYDLLTCNYLVLENLLIKQSVYPKNSIKLKLLSIWYDYLDTTSRDNILAPPASCCNKPARRR